MLRGEETLGMRRARLADDTLGDLAIDLEGVARGDDAQPRKPLTERGADTLGGATCWMRVDEGVNRDENRGPVLDDGTTWGALRAEARGDSLPVGVALGDSRPLGVSL